MNNRVLKKITIFSLIVMLLITLVACQSKDLAIPEVDYSYYQLENGLEIYVFEDHEVPLVKFDVWYNVGSFDEEEGLTGISHFLEHVMFLGTKSLQKDRIHELVSSVGGVNNAFTSYGYTCYYEEVPSSKLELAMAIEADRMRNLTIDSEEFNREKEVVKQERRMRIDNDFYSSAFEEIQAEAFKESPLHHQIVGWMDDIDRIIVQDMKDYYFKYYAPNNAKIIVSGDVNPEEVNSLAEKYYGSYQPQNIERRRKEEPKQLEERVVKVEKFINIPYLVMLYKIPEGNHQDKIAIDIMLDILVNNSTSRVTTELEKNREIIYYAGAGTTDYAIPGYAQVVFVPTSEENIEEVKAAFAGELDKLIKEGVSDEELEIIKKRLLKELVFAQRDKKTMANIVASGAIKYDNPDYYKIEIERIMNLKDEDISRVAKKYFIDKNRTLGYILPKKN